MYPSLYVQALRSTARRLTFLLLVVHIDPHDGQNRTGRHLCFGMDRVGLTWSSGDGVLIGKVGECCIPNVPLQPSRFLSLCVWKKVSGAEGRRGYDV